MSATLRCPDCDAVLPTPTMTGERVVVRCKACGASIPLRTRRANTSTQSVAASARVRVEDDDRYDTPRPGGVSPWLWVGLGIGALCLITFVVAIVVLGVYVFRASALPSERDDEVLAQDFEGARPDGGGEPRALDGPGRRLRYRWNGGGRFSYAISIQATTPNGVEQHQGQCHLTVSPNRRGPAPPLAGGPATGTGTGFVVSPNGYLLTCAHVVEDASKIDVAIGNKSYKAGVVSVDGARDLAVIKIEANGLPVLPLADSEGVEVGQEVRAIGFPLSSILGDSIKATRGTISGIERRGGGKILQVDASINPGNSGGPLVNEAGDVVAVISAKLTGNVVSNVGFAVPVNEAKRLLRDKGVRFAGPANRGKLDGPALVRQVSASTALVTVNLKGGPRRGDADGFAIAARLSLSSPGRGGIPAIPRPPMFGGGQADQNTLTADALGNIEQLSGEAQLPYMLGPPGAFFVEPLSPDGRNTWDTTATVTIEEKDDDGGIPFGPRFGPRGFGPRGFGPQGPGLPGIPNPRGRGGAARTYNANETVTYRLGETQGDILTIHKSYSLTGPQLNFSGDGQLAFDLKLGMPRSLDWQLSLTNTGPGRAGNVPIKVTYRLLDADAAAGGPAPPPQAGNANPPAAAPAAPVADEKPRAPTPSELSECLADLRSDNVHTRTRAANRLFRLQPVERRDEVVKALETLLDDANGRSRNAAAEALGVWGMKDTVPKLLPLLTHAEVLTRWAAMKALGTLRDERAAGPIAERLANPHDRAQARDALIALGPRAEKAVVAKLADGDLWVRFEACNVLKSTGTKESLPALEKAKTDTNGLVRHAAEQAVKAIGERK